MKNVTLKKRIVSIAMVLLMVATCVFGDVSFTAKAANTYNAGTMSSHSNGSTATGLYFTMDANDAPYNSDWTLEYMQTSVDGIKVIRDGVTRSIGIVGRPLIVKYSATEYFLKIEAWTLGDNASFRDEDIIVVEGDFYNAANDATINIETSYILYKDGSYTFFDSPILAGTMKQHSNTSLLSTGFYFTLDTNSAPSGAYYSPITTNAVKLIRDGVTYNVGLMERDLLLKENDSQYFFRGESWPLGDYAPLKTGDMIIIDGFFSNKSNGTYIKIDKTYAYCQSDGTVKISQVWPLTVELGNMQAHPTNTAPSVGETASGDFHFTLADSEYVPVSDAGYYPMAANTIQRIRNGVTTDATNLAAPTFVKYSSTEWRVPGWTIGTQYNQDYTWQDGDILLIEGNFNSAQDGSGVTFQISTTYVYYKDGVLTFSTTMPDVSDEISAGYMKEHSNKTVNTGENEDGFYFTMDANSVPYDNWNILYKPTSADAVKLIRDGVTTDVAITEQDLIVKYSETEYYFKIAEWTLSNVRPLQDGDILVIDGSFSNESNGTTFSIDKTYVMYYNNELIFSTTMPEIPEEIVIGPMQEHTNGYNENGIFFSTEANEFIPSGVYYNPVTEGTMVRIRDGVEEEIGHSDRETLYKNSETEWILQGWTIGGIDNMQDGDILKIDGQFKNETNGVTFTMETSYIVYRGGQMLVSDTLPQIVDVEDVTSEKTDATVTVKMNLNVAYNDVDSVDEVSAFLAGAKIGDVTLQSLVDQGYATITFTENTADKKHPTTMTIVFTAAGYATIDNFAISFESMNYTNGTVNYSGNATTFARWIEIDGRAGFSSTDLVHLLKTTDGSADGSSMISKDINQDGYKDEMDEYWTRRILVGDSLETIANDLSSGMPTTNPDNEMTIGVWNGSYHSFGTRDFNVLSEAEIDLIIGVKEEYSNGMENLLDKAEAADIDVIAHFEEWDSTTVPNWAAKSALRGFLMKDEPTATWKLFADADLGGLVDKQTKFNQLMPDGKEYYINLMAQSNAFFALYGNTAENIGLVGNNLNYNDNYVKQFTKQLALETLAFDSYGMIEENGTRYLRPSFYDNFAIIANAARDEGAIMQYTFCSAGHDSTDGTIPTPTADELRWQMNLGLTFGATELAHYLYTSHEDDYQGNTMVDSSTNKTTYLYDYVKQVNHEMKQWDELILNYTWSGTEAYDVGTTSTALSQMDNTAYSGSARTGFTTTQDMLVGNYTNGSEEAFMVTNAGQTASENPDNKCAFTMTSGDVTMTFAETYDRVAIVREGKTTVYFLDDRNAITFEVDAYEGVFVVPFTAQ